MLRDRRNPKALPDFKKGDMVITWKSSQPDKKCYSIFNEYVDQSDNFIGIECYPGGLRGEEPVIFDHCKPLQDHDYNGRNVFEV